jgi:hypothetical protein
MVRFLSQSAQLTEILVLLSTLLLDVSVQVVGLGQALARKLRVLEVLAQESTIRTAAPLGLRRLYILHLLPNCGLTGRRCRTGSWVCFFKLPLAPKNEKRGCIHECLAMGEASNRFDMANRSKSTFQSAGITPTTKEPQHIGTTRARHNTHLRESQLNKESQVRRNIFRVGCMWPRKHQ